MRAARSSRRGLSLLEVEVSLLIFMFGVVALMAFPSTLTGSTEFNELRLGAARIAQHVLEAELAQPFDGPILPPPPGSANLPLSTPITIDSRTTPGLDTATTPYQCVVITNWPTDPNLQYIMYYVTVQVRYHDTDTKRYDRTQAYDKVYEITGYKSKVPH